jgi:hypothetical protein
MTIRNQKPILNVLQVPGFSQVHWILLILIFMVSKRMDHASWKRMQDSILLHAIKKFFLVSMKMWLKLPQYFGNDQHKLNLVVIPKSIAESRDTSVFFTFTLQRSEI